MRHGESGSRKGVPEGLVSLAASLRIFETNGSDARFANVSCVLCKGRRSMPQQSGRKKNSAYVSFKVHASTPFKNHTRRLHEEETVHR